MAVIQYPTRNIPVWFINWGTALVCQDYFTEVAMVLKYFRAHATLFFLRSLVNAGIFIIGILTLAAMDWGT